MKDPRTSGRTPSVAHVPPDIERLRAAAMGRAVRVRPGDHALTRLVAHIDALGAGRPTVSPAAARSTGKPGAPGRFGLPD